jgi:hypothetical protein
MSRRVNLSICSSRVRPLEPDRNRAIDERVGEEIADPDESLGAEDRERFERGLVRAAHAIGDGAAPVAGVQKSAQVFALSSLEDRVGLVEQERRLQLCDGPEERRVRDVHARKRLTDDELEHFNP